MDGLIEELNLWPDAVKIDAEGAALNILSWAENISCRKIVVAAYHFPMEEVQGQHAAQRFWLQDGNQTCAGQNL